MRRVVSIILLFIGGWVLASEATMAWMDMGMGVGAQLLVGTFLLPFAAVPLALGVWASPGNRLAELGLTLMITAGVAAFCALAVFLVFNDPAIAKMMPPDQPLPDIAFSPVLGMINLLLIAGGGYALWRIGQGQRSTDQALT